jgi:hypothetical protein
VTASYPVVLGVDPGKTVGLAVYRAGQFHSHQMAAIDAVAWMSGWLSGNEERPIVVGIERFTRGSATGHHLSAQDDAERVIALVSDMCAAMDVSVSLQSAADAKKTVPDRQLKAAGWYVTGRGHANDAARHMGLLLMRRYPFEYERAVAGEFVLMNKTAETG